MARQLLYTRPGEEARMLARCQFGAVDGRAGATITYPIKGHPWRRNVSRHLLFDLDQETYAMLFAEVTRIRRDFPGECLAHDELWSDASEKANGITRDRRTGTLCYSLGVFVNNIPEEQYSLREDSTALLGSKIYQVISQLVAPYERLPADGSTS